MSDRLIIPAIPNHTHITQTEVTVSDGKVFIRVRCSECGSVGTVDPEEPR